MEKTREISKFGNGSLYLKKNPQRKTRENAFNLKILHKQVTFHRPNSK